MHWSDLASFLKTTAEQLHIPAGFCTVTQAHRTLFSCACGADKDALEKSRGASYWIYSATKPICAAAAMQMVEAGIFRLDEPVGRYLPEYANLRVYDAQKASHPVSDPLLIEHLLTMQGGFDYDLRPPAVQKLLQQKNAAADTIHIAAAFAEKPLQFEPGTHFRYSLCLDVLGAVMEAASGIRLGRWMREKLFLPLGMLHTGFSPNEKAPPLAPQFRQQPDGSIAESARNAVMGELRRAFRPEFLNRLDEIIMFKPLTKENLSGIIDILMEGLKKRLADKTLRLEVTDAAKSLIIERGFDPIYGARPLKRYLQSAAETLIAKEILRGDLAAGSTLVLDAENGELSCRKK